MSISVCLKNETRKYFGGQLVDGNVKLTTSQVKIIDKICLYFKGLTFVKFVKNGKVYKDQIMHFNKKFFISGYKYGKTKTVIPIGEKLIPFRFKLPDDLPTSIRGSCGFTKYTVMAKVFIQKWKAEKSEEEEFYVANLVDLNQVTNADTPLAIFETKVNQDHSQPFGFITAKLNALSCGFVPGQVIPFTLESVNETGSNVVDTNFYLIKRSKYKSRKPEPELKIVDDIVETIPLGALKNNEAKALRVSLQIPLLPASGLKTCELIDIEYWVRVVFKMENPKDNFILQEIVVIGNLPMSKLDSVLQGIKFA